MISNIFGAEVETPNFQGASVNVSSLARPGVLNLPFFALSHINKEFQSIQLTASPRFYKLAKSERVLATKALANKLTKATYYIMRDQVTFDEDKLFQ